MATVETSYPAGSVGFLRKEFKMDISAGYHQDRRTRALTDEDISVLVPAIIKALADDANSRHECRFPGISVEELVESVRFAKNFNKAMDGSKHVVWNTILVLGVGGILTILGWGLIMKIKELAGIH
jgi:hypothetical protein